VSTDIDDDPPTDFSSSPHGKKDSIGFLSIGGGASADSAALTTAFTAAETSGDIGAALATGAALTTAFTGLTGAVCIFFSGPFSGLLKLLPLKTNLFFQPMVHE